MKMKFDFLYKNGTKETFDQPITEENHSAVLEVLETIETAMREGIGACITFEKEGHGGHYVRMSEVVRVTTDVIEGESE
ncbi:hypothetical protein NY607_01745 [Lysinibacillus sp. A4]|uniref:hypothetical protein n=1 Tax=Lysinibacillus sp. A4 TaxID=2976269 RepID=UPI0021759821|nr:hypothetical protein [Lysinibacillus sp. A4]MCS5499826.1 hypothetical protein [Lysinibacillus sp. A4]